MPSTTSSVVSRPFASSTVMTPSLPTFAMASAMRLPMVLSPLAEMLPTWAISISPRVGREIFFSASTTAATALSMPRLMSIGSLPAATSFAPSRKMACASTVAVVVPSPAMSEVRLATSFTICAPMFANRSSSAMAFATVTPSLVISGAPNDCSRTTLRPFGPSVTLTASASVLMPWRMASRPRIPKTISFAICIPRLQGGLGDGRLLQRDLSLSQDAAVHGGAGLQGDRGLREEDSFEVRVRAECRLAGHLPEDVLCLCAAAERHAGGRAHREVAAGLEDPDVVGPARDGHAGRDGDGAGPLVEPRRQRLAADVPGAQLEEVRRGSPGGVGVRALHVADRGGEVARSGHRVVGGVDLADDLRRVGKDVGRVGDERESGDEARRRRTESDVPGQARGRNARNRRLGEDHMIACSPQAHGRGPERARRAGREGPTIRSGKSVAGHVLCARRDGRREACACAEL